MKNFSDLFEELDSSTGTNDKVNSLVEFFKHNPSGDSVYIVSFLMGRKPKQIIKTAFLKEWSAELAKIPEWLFKESYDNVGDLAEMISLIVPQKKSEVENEYPVSLKEWIENIILPLKKKPEAEQKKIVQDIWSYLSREEKFVFNKIITGSFRVGVSAKIVIKALALFSGIGDADITHRLMGDWSADEKFFEYLISHDVQDTHHSKPYPFFLAYQLDKSLEELGPSEEWFAEWKWDGIRAQIIKRNNEIFIWSRGEELITERFPELESEATLLDNGTVIDGEILAWQNDMPLPFGELQKRIGRKNLTKKILDEVPVAFQAFDIIEYEESDIRTTSYLERKKILKKVLGKKFKRIKLGEKISISSWEELSKLRDESRERNVEGFILKHKDSEYLTGRRRGGWWKWKVDPYTIDAVLIYAQRGHGRRASLYTDYTFGVWNEGKLISFAKAYSGLTDEEIRKVDDFVRKNTKEKFGPVRTVNPVLVFELSFEGIQLSSRHKSGIAVRFPRISKWRTDKKPEDADSLDSIKALLKNQN